MTFVRSLSSHALLALLSWPLDSRAQADDSYRFVLSTDKTSTAVSVLTTALAPSRFLVMGVRDVRSENGKRSRMLSDDTYAIDCGTPRRLQVLTLKVNKATGETEEDDWLIARSKDVPDQFRFEDLQYTKINQWVEDVNRTLRAGGLLPATPNSTLVASDYACKAARISPEARDALAGEMRRTAGLADAKELECAFSSPGGTLLTANVGFSESTHFVRWNDRWMNGAFVREGDLGFSAGKIEFIINRRSGAIRVTIGETTTTGSCDPVSDRPKKF